MRKVLLVFLSFFLIQTIVAQDQVSVVQDQNGGWTLIVNGENFMMNRMNWNYIPIGTDVVNSNFFGQSDDIIKAGLHGEIRGEPLGRYDLEKLGTKLDVVSMLMEVASCDADWQEAAWRERRWVSASQARELVDQDAWHEMIDAAVSSRIWDSFIVTG